MKNETKQTELSNEEQLLLEKLEEVFSLAPYCQKPPEEWIYSLGKAFFFAFPSDFKFNRMKQQERYSASCLQFADHVEGRYKMLFSQ